MSYLNYMCLLDVDFFLYFWILVFLNNLFYSFVFLNLVIKLCGLKFIFFLYIFLNLLKYSRSMEKLLVGSIMRNRHLVP